MSLHRSDFSLQRRQLIVSHFPPYFQSAGESRSRLFLLLVASVVWIEALRREKREEEKKKVKKSSTNRGVG